MSNRSGVMLTVPAGESIVQTLEGAGIAVSFSCLEGICGTCKTRVLEGIPDHRDSILSNKKGEESYDDDFHIAISHKAPRLGPLM